jgi:M6 family metalloprotease-like protein
MGTFNDMRLRTILSMMLVAACLFALPGAAAGAPYRGEVRVFTQPDGGQVSVRLFGTEFYIRPESLDGFTLAMDRSSGWICYAERAADGSLQSTGIRYRGPADNDTRARLAARGLDVGLRAHSEHIAKTVARVRQTLNPGTTSPSGLTALLDEIAFAKYNPTVGSGQGLVVLVDFSDRAMTIANAEYEKAFNGDTYDALGSIRTWIEAISYSKYTATHQVIGPMRAAYPTSHYVGGAEMDYSASHELMKEVYKYVESNADLTSLTSTRTLPSLVVVYSGVEIAKQWATGLWPHSGEPGYTTSEGVRIVNVFITNTGTRTTIDLDTMRHELGHSLFGWPDTYDYDDDSAGAGGFATETTLPCAPFRAWSGWMNVIDVVGLNQAFLLPANGDTCLRYKNASNASEFFMIEYMKKESPKRPNAPDDGLLIWHVDERGDNNAQDMTATKHYVLSVEQADGLFELEKNGRKRTNDLFHAGNKDRFDDTTTPNSKWWNGTASGLTVCNIGALDPAMSVTVGCSGPIEPASIPDGGVVPTGDAAAGGSGGRSGVRDAGLDALKDASGGNGGTTSASSARSGGSTSSSSGGSAGGTSSVSGGKSGGSNSIGGTTSGSSGGKSGSTNSASSASAGSSGSGSSGGASGSGGVSNSGGSSSKGSGSAGSSASSDSARSSSGDSSSGCSCSLGAQGSAPPSYGLACFLALALILVRGRKLSKPAERWRSENKLSGRC